LWSDNFCELVGEYSERIRSDLTNKYVHIRDMVSELKAHKAKPMKQVHLTQHAVGLENDHFSASDDCLPSKRLKMEPVGLKQELTNISAESIKSEPSHDLPALLRHSSGLCQLVPLSAMPCSNSADEDPSECRIVDVVADDADSRSSFDDGTNPHLVDSSHMTDEVSNSITNAAKDFELTEVTEPPVQMENNRAEPVAHCSKQHRDSSETNSQLASTRHIRYLETLLAV